MTAHHNTLLGPTPTNLGPEYSIPIHCPQITTNPCSLSLWFKKIRHLPPHKRSQTPFSQNQNIPSLSKKDKKIKRKEKKRGTKRIFEKLLINAVTYEYRMHICISSFQLKVAVIHFQASRVFSSLLSPTGKMADPTGPGVYSEDSELLLAESGCAERSWRLNFDGFQRSELKEKPPRGLHDCLGVLATEDVVAEYYQQQVEMLEGFNEMDALADRGFLPGMSKEERERTARSETLAIRLSNIANMVLFAAKVYASIRSGSLAIIASTLDSLLDLLSGFILWFTAFSMQTPNPYQYPIGKKRMQPLGILVFASVMATLGLQIILESARTLISDEDEFSLTKVQERWVISIMLSVTIVKLALVVYCRSFTNEIVKAYAQDHFFDVITNVIGLIAALLANYITGWIDPVGAIILALYTIRTWSTTVLENVNSLIGRTAAPEYLQKLTYLCWNHHKAIRHIDTVRAYTFGSHYFVEVDIVLPSDMPLREAHDIGENLQEKLEQLPEIERAFVHLDYEYTHRPEHAQAHS